MTTSLHPHVAAAAFALTPDPHYLFASRAHAEALAGLRVGLACQRGLVVVVAEVGMGKTTLAHSLLTGIRETAATAYVGNPRLPFDAILRQALDDFGVASGGLDRAGLLEALRRFLLRCAEEERTAVLVVDEAQALDDDTMEHLRLLTNVETYDRKLLQIVLFGQPELDTMLRRPHLRQIAERVAVRVTVPPLDRTESRQYVAHRLATAGQTTVPFDDRALRILLRHAAGVPRRMNILCHEALLLAWGAGAPSVTPAMAREAVRDHGWGPTRWRPGTLRTPPRRWRAAGAGAAVAATLAFVLPLRPDARRLPAVPAGDAPLARGDAPAAAQLAVAGSLPPTAPARPPASPPLVPAADVDPPPWPEADAGAVADDGPRGGQRKVVVARGQSLTSLVRRMYGTESPQLRALVVAANPAITDPDVIREGSTLVLPDASDPAAGPGAVATR